MKSGIQKEKENTKTLRQTHDLKIYDELIAKTKANILKFKNQALKTSCNIRTQYVVCLL